MSQSTESVFERSLRNFKHSLAPEERKWWAETTIEDVEKTIAAIQKKQEATRTLQNFRRIEPFLEGMKANAAIIEVFLNVHPFVAFIWGPMKFILNVACHSAAALNTVLEAYQRIGEHMPLFAHYQSLFHTNPAMKQVLELNFRDIFEFHQAALKFFRRSAFQRTLDGFWKNFEARFQRILDNLREHKLLLERHANLDEFEAAKQSRQLAETRFQDFQSEERLRKRAFLATWLAAADVRSDQESGQLARAGNPQSGTWLFRKAGFSSWFDFQSSASPILWIHGKPGAGKTVLASMVIEEACKVSADKVLYFYCHDQENSRNFTSMARSFLSQLLRLDETVLTDLYYAAVSEASPSLSVRKSAEALLDTCCSDLEGYYIVVDGLDECLGPEQKAMVSWLRKFVQCSLSRQLPSRCLIFSQYDAATRSALATVPEISLLPSDNVLDIQAFCGSQAGIIATKFALDPSEARSIADTTSERADGMFLFAKLVMHNLANQTTLAGLRYETGPSTFPHGLEQAYSRILKRILRDDMPACRGAAHRILAWMVCAARPVKWEDVQAAEAIDVDNDIVDMQSRRLLVDHVELCSPLVEMQTNGTLKLVHSTAKSFLITSKIVLPTLEHLGFATKCLEYLCLEPFVSPNPHDVADEAVLDGSYAFLNYAFACWTKHLLVAIRELALDIEPSQPALEAKAELIEALDVFLEIQYRPSEHKVKVQPSTMACVRKLQKPELQDRLLDTLASINSLTSREIRSARLFIPLKLFERTGLVQSRLEELAGQAAYRPKLLEYYGTRLYKCPRLYCDWHHEGFTTSRDRDEHVSKHERSFYCPHAGCAHAMLGCTTSRDLETHLASYHPTGPDENDFPQEVQKRVLKRKVSAELQCDQCPKKFARAKNLRAHSLVHTGERKFACAVCDKTFLRQHDCNVHERKHHGQTFVYCGTGDTWGCGKTFAYSKDLAEHVESDACQACKRLSEFGPSHVEPPQTKPSDGKSSQRERPGQMLLLSQQYPELI